MKRVLLVIDMQNDFIDGALGTKEAVAMVDNVVNEIGSFDGEIIATMDTHFENYMNTSEGKKLPVPHCIKPSEGWQLNERVSDALAKKNYRVVEKPTFGSTDLVDIIKDMKENEELELKLIGLCTDICVVSNALLLKANFPEMKLEVDASCCAGVTPESHAAALLTMKMCKIDII